MNRKQIAVLALLASSYSYTAHAAEITVFSTDFNGSLATEFAPGTAMLTGVQDYAGLGATGNQFGGNFLRSATGNVVTLTLNNLPTHSAISLDFLFAAIDSLDGTGSFPSGDFFNVLLDGVTIFNESFANAMSSQIQSYVPPVNVQLARMVNLGFGGPDGFYTDSAYDMGADPIFSSIAHTSSSLQIQFFIQGEGIQSLDDESWAMDNLSVTLTTVPVPAAVWLFGSGLVGLIGLARRKTA